MDVPAKLDPATEAALRSLHDIVRPPPVSWVPQTWGWGVLAGAFLVMLALVGLRSFFRYRANAYRREALSLLPEIERQIRSPASRQDGIQNLGEVLKRTALAAFPRAEVASLSNDRWVHFLDVDENHDAGHVLGRLLDDLEYRGSAAVADMPSDVCVDLVAAARNWIERHHVPA